MSVYTAGPGICILCLADTCASWVHPVFNHVAPYRYQLPTVYLCMADIANPNLLVCSCRTWICLDITRFMRSSASHPAGPHGRRAPKTVNQAHISGAGVSTQFA